MQSRVLALCLLVSVAVSGIGSAWAKTDAEIEEAVQATLDLRHPTDTPDWWKGLGPEAPRVIISMYEKTSHIYRRIRLLQGLTWFDDPVAIHFLKRQTKESSDDVIRTTGIRSIGISQGVKEADFIGGFLENKDPQTRFAAAEALKKINAQSHDPKVASQLEQYLKTEKVGWIKTRLNGELPKPKTKLTAVASSEDRLSAEFSGTWEGFWIAPAELPAKGMKSIPVVAQLGVDGTNGLKGELVLKEGNGYSARKKALSLSQANGKGNSVSGTWVETTAIEYGFDAELSRASGSLYIRMHSPRNAVTIVVRKK